MFRSIVFVLLLALTHSAFIEQRQKLISPQVIEYINSAQSTWTAGPSKFQSWSLASIKR